MCSKIPGLLCTAMHLAISLEITIHVVRGRGRWAWSHAWHAAETFAGKNFHGLVKRKYFEYKTFMDFRPHALPVPPAQKFPDKTFAKGGNTVKFAKVFTRESFQLYSKKIQQHVNYSPCSICVLFDALRIYFVRVALLIATCAF